jgi:hypothetical protein
LRGDKTRESLSPAWIGRTQSPNCHRVSTFREESLTKRGDPVRSRQPGQGRHLSKCPGARRNRGADPGMAATRTGARGGTKWGEESHPTWSWSVNLERKKGLKPGLAQGPDCLESGEACFLPGFSTKCQVDVDGKAKLKLNNKANRLKAGFIESALSGEVHRPQRTGLEKSRPRNCSPVFYVLGEVKSFRYRGASGIG